MVVINALNILNELSTIEKQIETVKSELKMVFPEYDEQIHLKEIWEKSRSWRS